MDKRSKIRFIIFIIIHCILYYSAVMYEIEYLDTLEEFGLQDAIKYNVDGTDISHIHNFVVLIVSSFANLGIIFYSLVLSLICIVLLVPFRLLSMRKSNVSKFEISLTSVIIAVSPVLFLIIVIYIDYYNILYTIIISIPIVVTEVFIYLDGLKQVNSKNDVQSDEDDKDYENSEE